MPAGSDGGEGSGPGPSPDVRRLLVGLFFMALLAASAVASAFFLGQPPPDGIVAPGVPFLAGSGAALVVAAAAVFYRTYRDR